MPFLGLRIGVPDSLLGGVKGSSPLVPGAPALTLTSASNDTTPNFDVDLPSGYGDARDVAVNDVLVIEYALQSGGAWATYVSYPITAPDISADIINKAGVTPLAHNTYQFRAYLTRGATTGTISAVVSNVVVQLFTPSSLSPALWLEADDLATLFQNIAGSTAVSADGQTVGTWNDKSGNAFHLTAAADDTTRPTYNTSGGLSWVTFDGVNDVLRRLAKLGMYDASACSVYLAMRANPATSARLVADGSSSSTNPIYAPMFSDPAVASTSQVYLRNDAGTQINLKFSKTGVFNNSDCVYGIEDTGSLINSYLNGVLTAGTSYTRTGTVTTDRFALGALLRSTPASFFAARVYNVVIVKRALTGSERSALLTYMGAKAGLSL